MLAFPVRSWRLAIPLSALLGPISAFAATGSVETDTAADGAPEMISVLGHATRRDGLVPTGSSAATKDDTPLIETPESVSVVTRAQMDQQNARTIVEALRYTSGVSTEAQNGFTPPGMTVFLIRSATLASSPVLNSPKTISPSFT